MLHVGLAAWIIQDGNYAEFEVGGEYQFALEFYPHEFAIASSGFLLETTPWQESYDAQGRKIISRDATRESFAEVPATDAWNHDGGHGHYVLECELR